MRQGFLIKIGFGLFLTFALLGCDESTVVDNGIQGSLLTVERTTFSHSYPDPIAYSVILNFHSNKVNDIRKGEIDLRISSCNEKTERIKCLNGENFTLSILRGKYIESETVLDGNVTIGKLSVNLNDEVDKPTQYAIVLGSKMAQILNDEAACNMSNWDVKEQESNNRIQISSSCFDEIFSSRIAKESTSISKIINFEMRLTPTTVGKLLNLTAQSPEWQVLSGYRQNSGDFTIRDFLEVGSPSVEINMPDSVE